MKPLIVTLWSFVFALQAYSQVSLPYATDFESSEGFVDGTSLSGDWTTTDLSVVITKDLAHSGSQSIQITSANPENIISLSFDPSDNSVLFADYYMQITASDLPDLPSFPAPETTVIVTVQPYVSEFGEWVFLDGDGAGSGTWFSVGKTVPLDDSGRTGWHRITLRLNLSSNSLDAYIDGDLLAVNLGFVEALLVGSEAINIYGSSKGVAYMDLFSLVTYNPLFVDDDLDGIPNAFEASYGLSHSIDDRHLDSDLDGLTNIEEYLYGTNPKVFDSDGGFPGIWNFVRDCNHFICGANQLFNNGRY